MRRRGRACRKRIGLDVVSDGELRRLNFQDSFGAAVEGFDARRPTLESTSSASRAAPRCARWEIPQAWRAERRLSQRRPVSERLRLERNLPLEEYKFVASVAQKPAKVIADRPGPHLASASTIEHSSAVYPDMDDFRGRRGRDRARDDRGVGRRRLPLRPYRCARLHGLRRRAVAGADARARRGSDAELRALAQGRRARDRAAFRGVTFGIHLCRGNQRSMWHREGSYDAIAERLFNELPHDRFLLEYDSPRAGSFEPLRFVPKGKVVVLGSSAPRCRSSRRSTT